MPKSSILLVGRESAPLQALSGLLQHLDADIRTRVVSNGHVDPLHQAHEMPTLLVMVVSDQADDELRALASRSPLLRPATIVVAARQSPALMRTAMQAGARDFIAGTDVDKEVLAAARTVLLEEQRRLHGRDPRINIFINAKGGSGATFLATNIAHIVRLHSKQAAVLIDLDFQFPSSGLSLDLKPRLSLLEALNNVNDLDPIALDAYTVRHGSGLALLTPPTDQIILPGEIGPHAVRRLVELASQTYEQVLIDLPRQVDPATAMIAEMATKITVVMQQSLAHVRDAKRLLRVLRGELEIAPERLGIVINRYDPKSRFQLSDLERALETDAFTLVHNDFHAVDAATNLGVPIYDYARNSQITKSLVQLAEQIGAYSAPKRRPGFLRRTLSLMNQAPS